MIRTLATLALFAFGGLVFSARAEPSFDCVKATTKTGKHICSDDGPITGGGHQWLDRQLARLYAMAKQKIPKAQFAALVESQRRFLKERGACDLAGAGCEIVEVYRKRLSEVARFVDVPDAFAIFKREYGELQIARFGATASVSIWTVGGNAHACQFEEDDLPQGGKGVVRFRRGNSQCRLDVIPDGDDLRVETHECFEFCGARASLDGMYRRTK